MKKLISFLIVLSMFSFSACASEKVEDEVVTDTTNNIVVTDSLGKEVAFSEKPGNVVVIGSSLTDVWLLTGGALVGTSEDSFDRDFNLDENVVKNVGSYKDPNVEEILALNPDLVVMSSLITSQNGLRNTLESVGVKTVDANINSFDDYLDVLKDFSDINEASTIYKTYGTDVDTEISAIKDKASSMPKTTGLMLRTSTSTLKALPYDNFAVGMMNDLGIENIADIEGNQAILDDLNIEKILEEDPYYIFLVIMGSESNASMEQINNYIAQNPAWNTLTAVKEGRFITLPKEYFHNKPNEEWADAYQYMFDIRLNNEK